MRQLVSTLPEELNVVYLCNNGVEANGLALLLARKYTGNKDVVAFEGAYHGYLSALLDVSPKLSVDPNLSRSSDYVHVVTLPDMYRGLHSQEQSENTASLNPESLSRLQSVRLDLCYSLS